MKTRCLTNREAVTREVGSQRHALRISQQGFTLVEAIVVIVLTGIIAGVVALFIRLPVLGYVDSVARADVTDTGDTALRRMGRDLRLALPNSIRTAADGSGNLYIEMLLTKTGGRYLSADDDPTGTILDFVGGALTFEVVGPAPAGAQTIVAGDSVVVYNLGPGIVPADAYAVPATNRAVITGITAAATNPIITMASNPFSAQTTKMPSPYDRFQIVSGPVTYRWDSVALTLTRYWGYTITEAQPIAVASMVGANAALIANGVETCAFGYTIFPNAISSALIELRMTLQAPSTDNGSGGAIMLFEQIHVDNTP